MYDIATEVVSIIQNYGEAYFVGGWVRDMLINQELSNNENFIGANDIDIATNVSIEMIQSLFEETFILGASFGVIVVIYKGISFEIATFRSDGVYSDGRRPSNVKVATIEEDAKRRDFTINGMFYNPINKEILDFVGGKFDIHNKIIRCIGDPYDRFEEDRLRMIRCVRLAVNLEFTIETNTASALMTNANLLFPSVAIERVWGEICKISNFSQGIIQLHRFKLLSEIFPQSNIDNIIDLVRPVDRYPLETPTIIKIMSLFPNYHDLIDICMYLKVTRRDIAWCKSLMNLRSTMTKSNVELAEWVHLYTDPHIDVLLKVISEHQHNRDKFLDEHFIRKHELHNHIERIISKKPLISANMLIDLGINRGPRLGKLLHEAENIAINLNLNDSQLVINELTRRKLLNDSQ